MIAAVLMAGMLIAPPDDPALAAATRVDRERLMDTLRQLPARRAARGGRDDHAGIDATEALITTALRASGDEPVLSPVEWALPRRPGPDDPPPRAFNTIIVNRPGATRPHEVLIVSAHLDAAPGAPGADDDGTGVAALLEVARVTRDVPTDRTVRIIFFALEEVGLTGSRAYLANWIRDSSGSDEKPEQIIGMVSLEMLGYFTDEPGSQRAPIAPIPGVFEPPTIGDFIALASTSRHAAFVAQFAGAMREGARGLNVFEFAVSPIPLPDLLRSDHAPFLLAGIPAAMLTDTADFRNPNYHRATDTIDTIDAERLTLVTRGVAAATLRVAGLPPSP